MANSLPGTCPLLGGDGEVGAFPSAGPGPVRGEGDPAPARELGGGQVRRIHGPAPFAKVRSTSLRPLTGLPREARPARSRPVAQTGRIGRRPDEHAGQFSHGPSSRPSDDSPV